MGTSIVRRIVTTSCTVVVAALLLQGNVGPAAADSGRQAGPAATLGAGAGLPSARFMAAATADVGGMFPGGLAVADFTGDGRADVAVAVSSVQSGPGVVVVVGDGHGGFSGRVDTTLPDASRACDLAAGDLNGDGETDLAVSTCTSGESPVLLMLGHGDGTFDAAQQLAIPVNATSHPAIGELNGDGKADVAVVLERGGLFVYFGRGDGTVRKPTQYPDIGSDTLRAVDVTGDGLTDLSLTGPATMVNKGGGVFASPVGADFFAIGSTLVDLDGDGILDGAGVDASGGHVLVGHGTGDGRYQLVRTITLPVRQTLSITGGDFTGDGKADLVVNGDDQVVYLLAGRGDGRLLPPAGYSTGPQRLTAADLGGSAADDLISLSQDPGTLYGVLGGGRGLGAVALVPSSVPGEVALGDVDGDGRTDAVTAGGILPENGGIESVLGAHLNRGAGRFGPTMISKLRDETASSGVAALTLVDVNGDDKLDAVGGFENFQFSPTNVFVALGKGNGRFAPPLLTDTGVQSTDVLDLAVADVTGDSRLDIVANTTSQLSVLPGNGNGTFRAPITSGSSGPEQTNTLLGDVTGDGITDAVVTLVTGGEDFSSSDLVVERGDGKGHFLEVQRVPVDTNILGAVLADFNGDGRPDLAADGRGGTNGGRGGLHVLLDTPSGSLGSPVFYPNGGGSLVAADFNLDGAIDLATDAGPTPGTAIGLNRGSGHFLFRQRVVTPSGPAVAGDVTGDGAADLISHPSATPPAFGLAINRPPR